MAKLSILGLYNFTDGRVFDDFKVPTGFDRQQIIDSILMDCAELGLVYADPDIMRHMIGTWCANKLPGWERIAIALTEEYNPLHNYDRYEEWTDKSAASASGVNESQVAGFNQSADMADRDRSEQSTSSNADGQHSGHLYGNIGVTTSSQMLQNEVDVRVANDMSGIIVNSFKNQFCIQIY